MSVNQTFSDQETAQDLIIFGRDSSVVWWPFAATDWVAADGSRVVSFPDNQFQYSRLHSDFPPPVC